MKPLLMFKNKSIVVTTFLICATALSCGNKLDLGDFDKTKWKADVNGCNSVRNTMLNELGEVKPELLGLYQKAIIKVLGQPEEQELYKRSQTYYIYWLDPIKGCSTPTENPRKLEVRFTALGIANEINIR
jgi:hypothetical protein